MEKIYLPMKDEIKAQWVADLRSGNFVQGQSYLQTRNNNERKYCCLGVLCVEAEQAGILSPPTMLFEGIAAYGEKDAMPPTAVDLWVLQDPTNQKDRDTLRRSFDILAGVNDLGETFETIADMIEAAPFGPTPEEEAEEAERESAFAADSSM